MKRNAGTGETACVSRFQTGNQTENRPLFETKKGDLIMKRKIDVKKREDAWKQDDLKYPCPSFGKCGGCSLLNVSYEQQLRKKEDLVRSLIGSFGPVHPITGMDEPRYYRNKVHAVFGNGKGGRLLCGTYQEGTHRIVSNEGCLLEDRRAATIIQDIRALAQSFGIPAYNEDTGFGILRHVLVRVGHETGQILVVLVTGSKVFPSRRNFVKELLKRHPEITTVVENRNDRKTSIVLGEMESVLWGKGYIEDILCGCRFRISPRSFYQVNSLQTEVLYRKAVSLAALTGKERVIDAYCGIGTIGMTCAPCAGEVIGIELNKDAVRDARSNAKLNGISNIQFLQADAGVAMQEMAERGERVDVLLMDPPRTGSTPEFLHAAAVLQPERIVYISCEPHTLARDVKLLSTKGYRMQEAWPVDQFPFTEHVETVCCLYHQKKDFISVPYEPRKRFNEGR